MAGNIIPAIATTNAIISGLIVLQALQLLRQSYSPLRNIHLQYKPAVPLSSVTLSKPNPDCGICRDTYTSVLCDPSQTRLGEVVKGILGDDDREVSVYEDKRVLSDPDWDDNNGRTLESLNVTRGKFLTIVDEDGEWGTIAVGLGVLPHVSLSLTFSTSLTSCFSRANHPLDGPPFILPSPLPKPPKKQKPAPPRIDGPTTPSRTSRKRSLPNDDDGVIDLEPTSKRLKPTSSVTLTDTLASPSKKRRLEEDGLVLLEHDDQLMDDVIDLD